MATVIYQGEVVSTDGPRGLDRPPQFLDTVEHYTRGDRGEVRNTDLDTGQYFVRWADGLAGWYTADELVVRGGAPASDPTLYVDGAGQ